MQAEFRVRGFGGLPWPFGAEWTDLLIKVPPRRPLEKYQLQPVLDVLISTTPAA